MQVELIPIQEQLAENPYFANNLHCQESLYQTIAFYKKVGYQPPWISYYAQLADTLVGCGAFKGAPQNNTVEIAYGTFEPYQQKGIGAAICKELVQLALRTEPTVNITARTLPENNYSTRILEKNGFRFSGQVMDPEDGEVWEWVYQKNSPVLEQTS